MEGLSPSFRDDPVYCDLAFVLPAPERFPSRDLDRPATIGVGVMSYYGWHATEGRAEEVYATYVAKMTRFVLWLLGKGYRVRLLVGAAADTRVVDDVMGRISLQRGQLPASQVSGEPATSLQQLMQQMVETDLIVSTRFHNIVAALMVGLPAISIGYAAKNDALLAKAGLSEFCQRIDTLEVELLMRQLDLMVAEKSRLTEAVVKARDELRTCAEAQANDVASRFLSAQ
jgi:polysaccharide pyruvyl transferase WcaK-like protein